ncbi:hypothetical protein IPG41_03655 [Candidatus Peregrinibacteria bacterium]|nr:MAG: hypothetical protein IPG41_03655 [Candidatus Peregrinibacteria bacterium]
MNSIEKFCAPDEDRLSPELKHLFQAVFTAWNEAGFNELDPSTYPNFGDRLGNLDTQTLGEMEQILHRRLATLQTHIEMLRKTSNNQNPKIQEALNKSYNYHQVLSKLEQELIQHRIDRIFILVTTRECAHEAAKAAGTQLATGTIAEA